MNHGKKYAPPGAKKYVQLLTLRFTHCSWRLSAVMCDVVLENQGKEERLVVK